MIYPENELNMMGSDCSHATGPKAFPWMKEMILYEVYVRDFSDSGDFAGLQKNLDKIQDLGANAIWLMPIHPIGVKNRKGTLGSPYSISNHRGINPEFGDEHDFRALVDEVHSRGMKIIIDLVANHAAHDNVLVNSHPDWFYRDGKNQPVCRVREWSDVIDINYNSSGAWTYMKQTALYWVREFDVDGFRCDVAGMVPLAFWDEIIEELRKIKPDVYMLAEWDQNCHLCEKAFNSDYKGGVYRLMKKIKRGRKPTQQLLNLWLEKRKTYPKNHLPLNFIENHDQVRASRFFGVDGFKPWAVFIFTIPGIPLIYNGQEVGSRKYLSLFEREPIRWERENPDTLKFYKDLIQFRKEQPATRQGSVIPLINDRPKRVVSYLVKQGDSGILCVLNLFSRLIRTVVQLPANFNLKITGSIFPKDRKPQKTTVKNNKLKINLGRYDSFVFPFRTTPG